MRRNLKTLTAMNYKNIIVLMALLMAGLSLCGQQMSDSKILARSFRAGSEAVLEVTNKYGDIHVSHSHDDSITVRVEITAWSNTGSKLDAMMSDVKVSISEANQTVRAETSFTKGITPLFESLKGLTRNLINFDSRLKIDYYVECPPRTTLRITNSYGDVYIGDETPELALKLSNGSLDAAAVHNAQVMELTFCKANVRSIDEGKVTLSFSELRTRETGTIQLSSVSSKVWIDRCGELDLDSKRDDMNIGAARLIKGVSYFSDIIASLVSGEINLSSKYGNLSFETIDPSFTLIDIRSSYTDIDLAMGERASYVLEINHTNAFVSLPGVRPEPERTEISAQEKKYVTRASVGSGLRRPEIRIDATRGEIRLLQK